MSGFGLCLGLDHVCQTTHVIYGVSPILLCMIGKQAVIVQVEESFLPCCSVCHMEFLPHCACTEVRQSQPIPGRPQGGSHLTESLVLPSLMDLP